MSAALAPELARRIAAEFPADFLSTASDDLAAYGTDWTRVFEPAPAAVALPRTTAEVARLVALCQASKTPIVPSGGRTGLAAGAVAAGGELVVSLARMNHIGAVDTLSRTLRVQAGAVTQAVHERCAEVGLTWPIDLASKGSSHIGGNIATNAGGVRVIRYGHTRHWVLGLEVVTASGEIVELGGELEKNNTGLDLRQLYIGSEGTLGIITAATLKLSRLPGKLDTLLFAADDLPAVLALFESVRAEPFQLMAYEFFTDRCAARLERHRGLTPPFGSPAPAYALVEVEDADDDALLTWIERALARPSIRDGVLAQSPAQAGKLWALREGISESLSATGTPHKNDVALPVRELARFCAALDEVFEARYPGWEICLFGHVGDGNIHINAMKPEAMDKASFLAAAHDADRAVFDLVKQHRGSISAEHGIGLLKKPFLEYSRTPAELRAMRAVKRALDPDNILNPGKIFDL